MSNLLLPSVFEDFNLFRFKVGDELALFVSNDRVNLDQIRRDANDIFALRLLPLLLDRGWCRGRLWLLRKRAGGKPGD
jgi:hypothetical protein